MKKLTKLLFVAFLSLSGFQSSFAQGFKDHFFVSLGYTAFLDYARLPTSNYLNSSIYLNNLNQLEATYMAHSPSSISYFTYGAKFRFNIVDFSDDASLAIHVHPALGLGVTISDYDETDIGTLSIPVMISYNTGNVSTYKTSKNKGFGIGVGFEYFNGGLIKAGVTNDPIYYTDQLGNSQSYTPDNKNKTSALLVPSFELAYRYWSKSNKAKELSLLVSMGSKSSISTDTDTFQSVIQEGSTKSPMHIRLMWSTYLNY